MLLRQLGRVSSRIGHVVQLRSARAVVVRMFELLYMTMKRQFEYASAVVPRGLNVAGQWN